jgi:hypothetical protein
MDALFDELTPADLASLPAGETPKASRRTLEINPTLVGPLGRVYLPNEPGTGVGEFQFVAELERVEEIEIGSMVAADTIEGVFVGAIVDMRTVGQNSSPHRTNLEGYEPVVGERAANDDLARVATVSVFHSPARRPIVSGTVRGATAEEVELATGKPTMKWPIPVGGKALVGGGYVAACLDGEYLLGMEAGHALALGTSGLAAKTSQTSVLVKSAMAWGGPTNDRPNVAALMFSPKSDLLFLDMPPEAGKEPTEEDLALYETMGVDPGPFEHVSVYAPGLPHSHEVNSVRDGAQAIRLGLRDAISSQSLRFWFPYAYEDEKLMSFFSAFEARKLNTTSPKDKVTTFDEFDEFCAEEIRQSETDNNPICWGNTHIATLHRIRRMVMGLPARSKGLLTTGTASARDDIPVDGFGHGETRVVDISALPFDARGYLIARTLTRLLNEAEEGRLGNTRVIVYVDELNEMYGPNSPASLRGLIARVVSQGRYAGISLMGAAQGTAGSKLPELMLNMATKLVGHTTDSELSSGAYGRIRPGLAETIVTLPPGQTAVFHPTYRAPMVVQFPRPAWRTGPPKPGEDGYRSKPQIATSTAAAANLRSESLARLSEGMDPEAVEATISGAGSAKAAVEQLTKDRVPDMHNVALVADVSGLDRSDPFNLDGTYDPVDPSVGYDPTVEPDA